MGGPGGSTPYRGFAGGSADQQPAGGASLSDILTSIQNLVVATNAGANASNGLIPHLNSGRLAANTLIQTGFVRVTGISVLVAGAVGALFDAATLAAAAAGTNDLYVVPAAAGFIPLNMVFVNGLVYKPGAAQVAAIFYART